jgi:hypothetical protein
MKRLPGGKREFNLPQIAESGIGLIVKAAGCRGDACGKRKRVSKAKAGSLSGLTCLQQKVRG